MACSISQRFLECGGNTEECHAFVVLMCVLRVYKVLNGKANETLEDPGVWKVCSWGGL